MMNNYISSLSILNHFNRNSVSMNKHMLHVASGLRVRTVAEDPSGWAIGQRMSVEIRGLDQATRNAQSSQSMLKVADGAVSSTMDILRSLKEKAIAAANDTMTDRDRQNIQKEFNQYIDQIDDNAYTTFNSKYLMDGSKSGAAVQTVQAFTNESLGKETKADTALTDLTRRDGDALGILATDSVTVSYVKEGKTYSTSFEVGTSTLKDIFEKANQIDEDVFDISDMDGSSTIGTDAHGNTKKTADEENAITVKATASGMDGALGGFTISVTDRQGNMKKSVNAALDAFAETIQGRNASSDTSLTSQTGTHANQNIKIGLGDMRSRALGLRGEDGAVINVGSQKAATAAINVLDNALARTLDQATSIGAASNRLDYTINNLTIQSENLTAAQTTILDANMAKEMLLFTRDRVLAEAAQAMLAQNNQNASWFLSLLG